jgi:BT4734-like, N-terminal domain
MNPQYDKNPAPDQQGEAQNISDQPDYNTPSLARVQSPDAADAVARAVTPEKIKSTPASPEPPQPTGASVRKIMVSMVNSATETETSQVFVRQVFDDIRSGVWRQQVEPIRAAYLEAQEKLRDPKFCEIALDEYRRLARQRGAKGERAEEIAKQALANFGKKKIAELKKALPGVLFSGVFPVRKADAIKEPSGLLCADLDTLGDRLKALKEELKLDPYVFAVFVSPSGDGLKVLLLIPVEVANFKRAFESVR